jgi:3-oxoacyl-[acyl-carrier protein] reductase
VIGLTRTLAIELGPRQIMVNAIAPGMVRTPMLADLSQERISQLAAGYPGGRLPEVRGVIGAGAAR